MCNVTWDNNHWLQKLLRVYKSRVVRSVSKGSQTLNFPFYAVIKYVLSQLQKIAHFGNE